MVIPAHGLTIESCPMGAVEHNHIASAAGEPVRSLERVRVRAGIGLEGDRYALGIGHYSENHRVSRDITLVETEILEELSRESRCRGVARARRPTAGRPAAIGSRPGDVVGERQR